MSYLSFDKSKLINLEYSLFREMLRTNRSGSYASSSIIGCNTRKYHGLLVCPIDNFGGEHHVLLSSLDVTVEQHGKEFNLGIHKYNANYYEPKGHKYIESLDFDIIPKTTYRVGGVELSMEFIFVKNKEQVLLKYTLLEATSDTIIKFKPFLAFRNVKALCTQNMDVNYKYTPVDNGILMNLYHGFPNLFMQFSKQPEFVPVPDWYLGIEYLKEQERGNAFQEDLFVPGYFEMPIKKGESIIFSASTEKANAAEFAATFERETADRIHRDTLYNNLRNSFQQFLVEKNGKMQLLAGYHWYGPRLRDTLISLPAVASALQDFESFKDIVESAIQEIRDKYLNLTKSSGEKFFETAGAPLLLFYTFQECRKNCSKHDIWKEYYPVLLEILNIYRFSPASNVKMKENGLIYAYQEGAALTWMDVVVDGNPVTQRGGFPVEVNAWWYNAIAFTLELAEELADKKTIKEWTPIAELVKKSYVETFWNENANTLYDCVNDNYKDDAIRPNMLFAVGMPYSPLDLQMKREVLRVIEDELLTPKGVRTLSPKDPHYQGVAEGNQRSREFAFHQGTVWPWLSPFFAEAYLNVYKTNGIRVVQKMLDGFEEEMSDLCIGSVAEMYNGNPPHKGKGAVSMAMNVAGVLRIHNLIEKNRVK
ncbi:MAG: glycogen debranching enzyme N-terminal domain-containing protein [Breznakibacter sp.]|nr:glycogen debranching enzyme N-terminal domain-containing protein [Breznakibacter sp.]